MIKKKITAYVDTTIDVIGITLLSINEYRAAKEHIPPLDNCWWLRSPGSYSAAFVYSDGCVGIYGTYVDYRLAVRPALKLNLKSEDLQIGDIIIYGDIEWSYIGENLAIAKEALCEMPFRKDWEAKDANIYEASDIKRYLDEWLKEAKKNE